MLVSNEEACAYFRRRWERWVAKDMPEVDEGLRHLLQKLSILPGVTPVWSCQSHLESDDVRDHKFNITLCATEEGVKCLFQVEQMFDHYPSEERPVLEQSLHIHDFSDVEDRPVAEWEEWYGWEFSRHFDEHRHGPDDVRRMIDRLEHLVEVVGRANRK